MNRDPWNDLSYFQSFDLVQREFKQWHGRELNAERTEEIVSSFIQGREYFVSARSAAEAVRPLLLYYAVLSVSRALIIFLGGKSEATLRPSHGLEAAGWDETLKVPGQSILDLEVVIGDGSFSELAAATGNSTFLRVENNEGLTLKPLRPPLGETKEHRIAFRDVLSREPLLCNLFREVTLVQPSARPGLIVDTGSELSVRFISDLAVGTGDVEELKSLFRVPSNVEVTFAPPAGQDQLPTFVYRLPHESGGAYSAACPIIEYPTDGQGYLIAPWPNLGYLSPLLRCFVQAYILGMLSRYFPSRWMKLLGGRKGDAMLPLLQWTIEHLAEDFPRLVRLELRHF